jgi:hypothetical protein
MRLEKADAVLLAATGTPSVADAVSWLADGHPIEAGSDLHAVLRALVLQKPSADYERATRRIARIVAASHLDTAAVLFDRQAIVPAARFAQALSGLAAKCHGGNLDQISASALISAQREDSFTLEALAAVAGLSYNELADRVDSLPSAPTGPFMPSQIRAAFATLDGIVKGILSTDWPDAVSARPLELMPGIGLGRSGWDAIEDMRANGVPYEVLLAQRVAGGSWLAHRNRTSSKLATMLAAELCRELDRNNVPYRRSTALGGDRTGREIAELSGCDKQLGLLILDPDERAAFGVIFSVARDSGTASKNASRLRAMKRSPTLRIALMVAGPGWAARNETADLAVHFGGYLYSDSAIQILVKDIVTQLPQRHKELP